MTLENEVPLLPVLPSEEVSIWALDETGHSYKTIHMAEFKDGLPVYNKEEGYILQFVKKNEDGTWQQGLQSEHLIQLLIDRHKKLNAGFPSREGSLAITKMEEALFWLQARVIERTQRGVMGKLEK